MNQTDFKRQRIDQYLVEKGYAPSRTKAQEMIEQGLVSLKLKNEVRLVKSKNEVILDELRSEILIQPSPLTKYVSRAGVKLEKALTHLQLAVERWQVLDVGISTGGFSDCLLQRGASSIVGVDVGHNQLSPKLQSDPRIKILEGLNARELHKNEKLTAMIPAGGFDLAVVDVSFISSKLVVPSVVPLVKSWGFILLLVKPQFEVGAENLNDSGVVKDSKHHAQLEKEMRNFFEEQSLKCLDYFPSELPGRDGNLEFFAFLKRV